MTYFKSACYKLGVLILVLISLVVFLITTTPGLYTLIKLANLILPGVLHVEHIDGCLMQRPVFTGLTYTHANQQVHLEQGRLVWQITTQPLSLQINELNLRQLQINQTTLDSLQLNATLSAHQWHIQQLKAKQADLLFTLTADGLTQTPYPLSGTLDVASTPASNPNIHGQLKLSGDRARYSWQGQLTGAVPLTLRGVLADAYGIAKLNTTLSFGANRMTITGYLPNQLNLQVSVPEPQHLHPTLTGLHTTITATGTLNGTHRGQLTVSIGPGTFQSPLDKAMPAIPFQGGHLMINLTPKALQSTGSFTLDPTKVIDLTLSLPNFDLRQAASPNQRVDGDLSLHVSSLDFLQAFSTVISKPHGQLSARLIAKGSLSEPELQGTIELSNAGVAIPEAGLILNPIQATLTSHDKHWAVLGSMRAENGKLLALKGQGDFSPQLTGLVTINGDDFPALKTAEYTITMSPQLTLTLQPNTLAISGSIVVPKAELKPMSFSNTVNLTDDVVFIHDEPTAEPVNTHISADVQIKMGHDVALDVQGLHGFLDGAITVKKAPEGSMSAIGELSIRDGKYHAYGQDLIVDQGQLLFSGATLANPDISLRAIRQFNHTKSQFSGSNQLFDFNAANLQTIDFGNQVTVGIAVSGHLNSPKIKLISVPASLSQADILSMLLLGKPANQASQSGGQLLLAAISSMNLDSGTKGLQLLTQLKQSLGFDFNVQSNSLYNQKTNQVSDNTAVVVGKALSKRLYLSYNIGLFQKDSNVLTLKYLLNKFFSVQVTTSNSGNGLDLLYSAQP